MANLVETIQEIVKNTNKASDLTSVFYGTVTSTSPLKILVEQKLELTEEFLILTKNVKDYEVDVTIHDWNTETKVMNANHDHQMSGEISVNSNPTVNPSSVSVSINNTINNSMSVDTRNIDLSHNHLITGRKSITIHNALKNGDKVILIQQQGGQNFVVLDKI